MFLKIPLNADLTKTSYRCFKETEEDVFIEYNNGDIHEDWEEISEERAREIAPEWFATPVFASEPSQLDRIEEALAKVSAGGISSADIEAAILEGVNAV